MVRAISLTTPLTETEVRRLRVDDEVFLTGTIVVMHYPWHFERALSLARAAQSPPMNLQNAVIFHSPTSYIKRDDEYQIRFIGVTTSAKLNPLTPDIIELFKIRCIIGKGGMDKATLAAMQTYGCVYAAMPGGCSAAFTPSVQAVVREYWPQSNWADNVLELSVNRLGPLLIAMDSHGRSLYEDRKKGK
jgi:fumarate hydratase subunit beta